MFHTLRFKINRKSDSGPYPSKWPKELRTHQVTLGRKLRGRKRECQVGLKVWSRNFHLSLWLHFSHWRSHNGPRWGWLAGLTVISLGLRCPLVPPHTACSPHYQSSGLRKSVCRSVSDEFKINKSKIKLPSYPPSSVITSFWSVKKGYANGFLIGGYGCPWAGLQRELSSTTFYDSLVVSKSSGAPGMSDGPMPSMRLFHWS